MVKDYSHGIVHEPFFYGQDYNFPLEAWAAVPGYWAGLPPHIILPIISLLFSLTPFFIILHLLYKKEQYASGVLILICLCTLSLKYDLMSGIPRGFVQGLFTASLALLFMQGLTYFKTFIIGFLLAIAFVFNPNSLFLSVCILFIIWYKNKVNLRLTYIVIFLTGVAVAYCINWQLNHFYTLHPSHNLHHKDPLQYHLSDLARIGELDALWTGLSPLFWNFAIINLLIFITFIIYFFKQKKKILGWFTAFIFLMLLASVALSKCADGSMSFLFPYARFYLSIPIIYALLLWLNYSNAIQAPRIKPKLLFLIPLLGLGYTIYKTTSLDIFLEKQLAIDAGVQCMKVEALKTKCSTIQGKMRAKQVNLLVNADRDDKVAYGCPCLWNNDSFLTLNPEYERRTWRLKTERTIKRQQFILVFWDDYKVTRIDSTFIPLNSYLFLVQNPGVPATEWLKNKGYALRKIADDKGE